MEATMTIQLSDEQVFVPNSTDAEYADLLKFLEHHPTHPTSSDSGCYLVGPEGEGKIELPSDAYRVLYSVVKAMQRGQAVAVMPQNQTLTTQEAADILKVSRQTLVRLLEDGVIPFTQPSVHRKILLTDVLAYREVLKQTAYDELMSYELDPIESAEFRNTTIRNARRSFHTNRSRKTD
jgi:excisionase family DNA binding protein